MKDSYGFVFLLGWGGYVVEIGSGGWSGVIGVRVYLVKFGCNKRGV